jgi:transposase
VTDRQPPHHRNLTCYTDYRCRLPECVERYRQWRQENRRKRREGQAVLVDAEPVRRHLEALRAQGITPHRVGLITGIDDYTLHAFFPSHTGRRCRKHRTSPEIAQKILAVTPETAAAATTDGTGTRRRIQALAAAGWPQRTIAGQLGLHETYVKDLLRRTQQGRFVYASTADQVARAYEELKKKKPTRCGIDPAVAKRVRTRAAAKRWPTTRYWDTRMDVIDDPDFEPLYGVTRREQIAQDANWLMRAGLTKEAAAQRLGVHKSYIDHAFNAFPQYDVRRPADTEQELAA